MKKCPCCNGTGGMTLRKATGGVITTIYNYRTTCDRCDGTGDAAVYIQFEIEKNNSTENLYDVSGTFKNKPYHLVFNLETRQGKVTGDFTQEEKQKILFRVETYLK